MLLTILPPVSLDARESSPIESEVLIVADARSTAAAARVPTAENPVYYFLLPNRERALGPAWARDRVPDHATVEAGVVKALASRHYLRTQAGGPAPTLVISVVWGSAQLMFDEIPESATYHEESPSLNTARERSYVLYNSRQIYQLVGGGKSARRMESDKTENGNIADALKDDRLYLAIGAFDAEALRKKKRHLVWRTMVSLSTLADDLDHALPTLLKVATPFLGREVDRGILIPFEKLKRGAVDLRPLNVIGIVPETKLP